MTGLAVFFRSFGNLVVNADDEKVIDDLVDFAVESGVKVLNVSCFARYTRRILERLKNGYGIVPKKVSEESVYILERADFVDFSDEGVEIASAKDVDEIVLFVRAGEKEGEEITDQERKRVFYYREFVVRLDGKIVSKANVQGISQNYFQVGGVRTKEEHRRKGYAEKAVSVLIKNYFEKGLPMAILFTGNENTAAQNLYRKMGFRPVDAFMIAMF